MIRFYLAIVSFTFILGASQFSSAGDASVFSAQGEKDIYTGGGGHEVPTPFDTDELLDGEVYVLNGKVMWPYLRVNKKKQFKFYLLQGTKEQWERWELKDLKLLCRTHWTKVLKNGRYEYVISLEALKFFRVAAKNIHEILE